MHYTINDGSFFTNCFVDIEDNFYKQNTILLPEKLPLNREINLQYPEKYGDVREKLIVHKQIPSIEVNNNQHHNCLNIIFGTVTP